MADYVPPWAQNLVPTPGYASSAAYLNSIARGGPVGTASPAGVPFPTPVPTAGIPAAQTPMNIMPGGSGAGLYGAAGTPQPGGGLSQFLGDNNNMLITTGLGLMSGRNKAEQFQNAMTGYTTGSQMDFQQSQLKKLEQSQKLAAQAYAKLADSDPQFAALIQANPQAAPDLVKTYFEKKHADQEQSNTSFNQNIATKQLGLETQRTNAALAKPLATYGVVNKDQFGNDQYGWIDPVTRTTAPVAPPAAPAGAASSAMPSLPPPPPGADPKEWRTEMTKQAATGSPPPQTVETKMADGSSVRFQWNGKTGSDGAWEPMKASAAGTTGMGTGPVLSETQSKDLNYFTRGQAANSKLAPLEATLASGTNKAAGAVPGVGNYLTSKDYQLADQAGRDFLAAILRKDSGGAISDSEMQNYGRIFLPQPGDAPEVIAQKREARATALDSINKGMGVGAQTLAGGKPAAPGAPAAAPAAAPSGGVYNWSPDGGLQPVK